MFERQIADIIQYLPWLLEYIDSVITCETSYTFKFHNEMLKFNHVISPVDKPVAKSGIHEMWIFKWNLAMRINSVWSLKM